MQSNYFICFEHNIIRMREKEREINGINHHHMYAYSCQIHNSRQNESIQAIKIEANKYYQQKNIQCAVSMK